MIASDPPRECDLVVVGAGIVGLAVAREMALRHDGMRIVVLESEAAIGAHQTSHSSGVIHAGIPYAPGSLKARLCVEGSRELFGYCEEHGIPARRSGQLIVATREQELPRLDELERRGRENGVSGLDRLTAEEIAGVEPNAAGLAALHSPATAFTDFRAIAASFASELVACGGSIATGCAVHDVRRAGTRVHVRHLRGATRASAAIACAGAWADRLAVRSGADADPRIVPFRGAYLKLRPNRRGLIRSAIYPVPDPDLPFLGAHFTRSIDGEVLLGPTALLVGARDAYSLARVRRHDLAQTVAWPGTWRLAARHWRDGAIVSELQRLVPSLAVGDVVAGPAGIRGQALARDGRLVDDFVIDRTDGALHVRNAPSPAATSCLPLARLIADRAEEEPNIAGG
jgi:(S)-2-hydroxyglutarate dehydrogenase